MKKLVNPLFQHDPLARGVGLIVAILVAAQFSSGNLTTAFFIGVGTFFLVAIMLTQANNLFYRKDEQNKPEVNTSQSQGEFKGPGDLLLERTVNLFTRKRPVELFDYLVGFVSLVFLGFIILAIFLQFFHFSFYG